MTFDDPRQDRTALRLQLYHNGFCPLPNHNKACFLPEWSTVKVTPELIQSREWARSRAWSDTGLRCGEIVAIDWDVNDETLLNDLLDAVVEQGVLPESLFVRIGKPPRELWVFRTSEPIGKRTTGGFVPAGTEDDPDQKPEQVEILGKGCQFAAYGWRDDETQYQWPEQSLLDHKYMDLPTITLAQVEALKDFAIAFFEKRGLVRKSPMAGTDGGYNHVYDLTPDMVFTVQDHGAMALPEIEGLLRAAPDAVLRCTVEAIRPGTSGSWAGMISLVHGAVCISDHGTYTSHFPAELDDTKAVSKLGAKLDGLIRQFEQRAQVVPDPVAPTMLTVYEDLDPKDDFDTNLARALKRYVFSTSDDVWYDLGSPKRTFIKPSALNTYLKPFQTVQVGKKGGETIVNMFDMLASNSHRLAVDSAEMRPDIRTPIFKEEGVWMLNTFVPVFHERVGGDAAPGHRFMELLLPIPAERHYMLQWLKHKWEHPEAPGVGIVMVAKNTFGTGRGTFFHILSRMFGQRYVSNIDFKTLTGKTSQSQYNEWLTDSLIVTVNEASENEGSKWQGKANAYEHVKDIIDPSARRINVVRKTLRNGQATSYASVMIATNHGDMMVIPKNDRRLAVLQNGEGASQEFWDSIRDWARVPANIGAFLHDILQTDMKGFSAYAAPPMTMAKHDMVESTESDLDHAMTAILKSFEGPLVTWEQFNIRLEDYAREHRAEFPEGWPRIAAAAFRNRTMRVLQDERVMIDGQPRKIRGCGVVPAGAINSVAEIQKLVALNGPQQRPIKTSNTVVSFPQRGSL